MFEGLKRSAGQPTRDDWNRLLELLETLPITPGPGLLMRRTPSGTTLWPRKRRGGAAADALQFSVTVRLDGETWKAKVRPGWVRSSNPDSGASEPFKDWMPTVGTGPAVPLNDAVTPEITVTSGQTVYCRVAATSKGVIEVAPKIEAGATPEAGVHFQPPNADVDGDLYLPIAKIEISGDPLVVTITQIQQGGPINVVPNLPEHKNVGGKFEVSQGRVAAGDTYNFRTLEQLSGVGEEIIKGSGTGTGDTIPFRRIAQRATSPQVRVGEIDADIIKVEGNGYDSTEGAVRKFSINVVDGLVTSFLRDDTGGWWGTITHEFDLAAAFGGGSPVTMVETYEAGSLISVTHSSGYASGDGTQGSPGVVVFNTRDYP